MYGAKFSSFNEHRVYNCISMPSSSSCTATNEPTAIVSELNNTNNITISDNGMKNTITRIPAHKFYGDTTTPMPLLIKHPNREQNGDRKNVEKNVISKQSDRSNSTTSIGMARKLSRPHGIRIGDEVLVEIQSDQFYLGIVNDTKNDTFLTRFENGTERWSPARKLTKLHVKDENAMCVICKEYDEIVQVCSQCRRGFHKMCIKLSTSDECSSSSSSSSSSTSITSSSSPAWQCHKCSNSSKSSKRADQIEKANKTPSGCYCGEQGDWFMQMLQCARCLQWFHAKCIKCLNFPLYFGDRFYLFACAKCNHDVEFIRRLHMNIEDVVHLLLFNLTLQFRKRYYNLTNVIYPYARDNWHALQLPPKLKNMMSSDVKDEIMKALRTHADRFKAGSEVKKKVLNWALVSRTPPKAPNIVLPPGPLLTEKYINDLFKEEARINFMAQNIHNPAEVAFNDSKIKDIMSGKNVASHIITSEDTSSDDMDSGAFSSTSDDDIFANFVIKDKFGIHIKGCNSDEIAATPVEKPAKGRKSSQPQLGQSEKSNDTSLDLNYSSDDTFTLDAIIPPPKNFSGINNPFLIDSNTCHENRIIGTSTGKTMLLKYTTNSENVVPSSSLNKGQVQMVRTVKRRLSANDIIIGPNMEVKRRKLKKRLENVEVISTTSLADLPKSATYLPISADSKRISITALRNLTTLKDLPSKSKTIDKKRGVSLDSNLFAEQNSSTTTTTPNQPDSQSITTSSSLISSISSSPIKDTLKEESMADLQSSLNIYFGGVVNRIGNGENFAIKGKRILSDGRLQYLIEWDGVS